MWDRGRLAGGGETGLDWTGLDWTGLGWAGLAVGHDGEEEA